MKEIVPKPNETAYSCQWNYTEGNACEVVETRLFMLIKVALDVCTKTAGSVGS